MFFIMNRLYLHREDIKMLVCDFDGIFTDGKLTIYSDGKTSKTIDYKDIMAIANLIKRNIKFAIISGENSVAIDILQKKFPSIETFQNERNKIKILKDLLKKHNLLPENILYMGDDINDIDCLNYISFPVTVANAHSKVKNIKNIFITTNNGGQGAVREVVDFIL